MKIHRLDDADFDEFFELVCYMIKEAEFRDAQPDKQMIWNMCQSPDGVVFLAKTENKIVGFLAGLKQRYFFSPKERVTDMGFYVLPDYRGTTAALRLILAIEEWAKQHSIHDVYMGQTTAVDVERTMKFYNHLGYKTVGFNTVKHLN